jgi:hypothetical protein
MAFQNTPTISYKPDIANVNTGPAEVKAVTERLSTLLEINSKTERQKQLYRSNRERLDAELMYHPLKAEEAFSYLGLMLGILPPATIFTRFVIEGEILPDGAWFIGVLLIVNTVSAVVGFISGKSVGKLIVAMEKLGWSKMISFLPFIGILWGIMAGGAGGFVIFVFGAIFGAIIGGMVGAIALPIFVVFHRILKRGDVIDAKHFWPVAFGVTLSICSFILGR